MDTATLEQVSERLFRIVKFFGIAIHKISVPDDEPTMVVWAVVCLCSVDRKRIKWFSTIRPSIDTLDDWEIDAAQQMRLALFQWRAS
jgi:hypothetical protein